jgi:lipopolysaccharide transport system permease protein
MQTFSFLPSTVLKSFWQHRRLIRNLVQRDVVGRYRGSILGILWSFFNPVLMLIVYTFVFSVIFKARWGAGGESKAAFALILFAGLILFNLFAECLNRAPGLIIANANYVKKVVFPLEILPWVSFGAALFHALISFGVWLLFSLVIFGVPPMTILLFPLLLIPLTLFIMGMSWLLASLGVFLRDVSQVVGLVTTTLMFLTPIFFPISAMPESYRILFFLNPLTFIVEQARGLLIFGTALPWKFFMLLTGGSAVVAWLGFFWFQKTRKGFADVL